ncbi:hypothetical protein M3231_22530 [Neobacillus mesonae]|nr:hypothetical protein [Neobacillus mesonae]
MNKDIILDAIASQSKIVVHLVSGEFYTGFCKLAEENTETFTVCYGDTNQVTVPFWAVKRVKPYKNIQ